MYTLSRQYEAGKAESESDAADADAPASRGGVAAAMVAAGSKRSFARLTDEMEPTAAAKPRPTKMEATAVAEPNATGTKLVESPPISGGKAKVSNSQETPVIGAVAVPGINAARLSSFNSDADDSYSYTNRSVEGRSEVTGTGGSTTANREEPVEATRVADVEADIEAQVQTRMQNQAKDIAQMVHRELMTNAAVPVDVQPSVQDTASVTTKDHNVDQGDAKKKKICIIAIVLFAIIAAVGIGVGVAVSKKPPDDPNTQSPTLPPTPVTTRAQIFQGILEPISGEQLSHTDSPQFQALDWLANADAANLTVGVDSDEAIKSRYVAAVLYYAFGGDNWLNKYRFLSERDICSWNQKFIEGVHGLSCGTDGTVELFQLPGNNVAGSIPPEIGYFSNLIGLNMANNSVGGSLASIVDLTRLEELNFTQNALTGTLPEFLFTHRSLTNIDLEHNRLFGSISDSLGNSNQLRVFWARNNSLTGTIPSAVGQSWVLGSVTLSSNELVGTIPEFVSSSRIWDLHLENNKLTGTIPTTIGSLSSLATFYLAGNGNEGTGISGSIPSEIGRCQNLLFLWLDNNTIVESIPTELGSITSLENLLVRNNRLTGTIPVELGNSPLRQVDFDANYFTGDIGPVIDSLPRSLEVLAVGGNQLRGTIPSSIGSFSSLIDIDFGRNDMNGTIPSQFGNATSLEALRLGENNFVGTLPTSIASLPNLLILHVYGNNLTGSLDEFCAVWNDPLGLKSFAANTCGESEIECACCSYCCGIDIFECREI